MGALVRYLGVWLASLIAGFVCALPVFFLGLAVPMYVIWPLTLASGALFAAMCASWLGTLLASDHTQSRMLVIVIVAEVVAVALTAVIVKIPAISARGVDVLVVSMAAIALGTTWATRHFREPRSNLGRYAWITVFLLVIMVLVVYGVVRLTCSTLGCVA